MTTTEQKKFEMTDFTQLAATRTLRVLAQQPYDLTVEGNFSPERIKDFVVEGAGLKLCYAPQRVTEEVIVALQALADEAKAVKKMQWMQGGEVINCIEGYPSDNRAVLHTAMRDFFEEPNTSREACSATELAKGEHAKLQAWIADIEANNSFTDMIYVGIGGSELGPKALYQGLRAYWNEKRRVHFVGNVDPDDVANAVKDVDLSKTVVVVVSKSGSTLETKANEELLRTHFEKAGLDAAKHFVAVTGKGSAMDNPERYAQSFYIWDYVGGRFSSTSMVGGVLISFGVGYEQFYELLRGCSAMDKLALKKDIKENLPLLLALLGIWNHNFLNYPALAVVSYSQALHRFPAHLQQCDMESNGKLIDRNGKPVTFPTGPVVFGEPGTSAQHSFFQLLHQGTDVVPIEFIGFKECQVGEDADFEGTTSQEKLVANLLAQAIALATGKKDSNPNKLFPGNRPSSVILGKKLTPFALGSLLALYEHKIAFQGFIWNINSFDQEGVELGKVLANKIIDCTRARRVGTEGNVSYPEGEAFLDLLRDL